MSLERVLLTLYGSPVSDMLLNTLKSIIYVDDMGFFPLFPTYWMEIGRANFRNFAFQSFERFDRSIYIT